MGNSLVETKVAAGSATLLASGYLAWALFMFVPWLKANLPSELQGQLPVLIAWALSGLAAYFAPHTHRPDLVPVTPVQTFSPLQAAPALADPGDQPAASGPDIPHA